MDIKWVASKDVSNVDEELLLALSNSNSFGSYLTYNVCKPNNVICSDKSICNEIINKGLHKVSNLHIPKSFFIELGYPEGVNLLDVVVTTDEYQDDILALTMAMKDKPAVVVLIGFDLTPTTNTQKEQFYINITGFLRTYKNTPFVVITEDVVFDDIFGDYTNLLQSNTPEIYDIIQ